MYISRAGHFDLTSSLIAQQFSEKYRVKSDNFGHRVNSDIHLQSVKIQMRRHCLLS